MTTTGKALQVLHLFNEERKQLRAGDVITSLGVSSATAYRYLADLEEAGLIERVTANHYALGPTIVELDRQIRVNDPLLAAAGDIMEALSERTGGTILLSRHHGRKVVCVHQVRGRLSPAEVSYERGRAMPLYWGATSKIILAHLSAETLRELTSGDAENLHRAGLPTSFDSLSQALARMRADRVVATDGEVDAGAMGWAAAIHHRKQLLGSLSVVISSTASHVGARSVADQLLRAALRIEGRLEASTSS